ncbi:MAG: ion transporter [Methylobacteriaceae bacterium]|nr:ion transporter [Methylobacteriaceae bacterium]
MKQLYLLYAAPPWRVCVGIAVFVNSIVLGAITEVPGASESAHLLAQIDGGLLALLVLDALLLVAVKRRAVLHNGWDLFDVGVTLVSVAPSVGMLSAFRVLRVIRVLRLISFIPHGRATVDALLSALRNMSAAFVVLAVVFYSFVVIATNLFRDIDPARYGTLGRSAAHLYTVMVSLGSNLDTEVVFTDRPWALLIFGAFIVVASFGLLNMFIAVLVAALKEQLDREHVLEERARFNRLEQKVDRLAAAIEALGRAPAK